MRKALSLALALGAASLVAACGGGGSAPGTTGALPPGTPAQLAPNTVSMTLKNPSASSGSSLRHPTYVSTGTASIGVVVTNQGATPSPAQFVKR